MRPLGHEVNAKQIIKDCEINSTEVKFILEVCADNHASKH